MDRRTIEERLDAIERNQQLMLRDLELIRELLRTKARETPDDRPPIEEDLRWPES